MDAKEYLEGNKKIAVFMGAVALREHNTEFDFIKAQFTPDNECFQYWHENKLKYNSSWDWLMPVIEKISEIEFHDGETAYPRTFGMTSGGGNKMFRFNRCQLFESETLINSAFLAVVDYITHTQAGGV